MIELFYREKILHYTKKRKKKFSLKYDKIKRGHRLINRGVEINFFKRMMYEIALCLARHAKFARFRIYRTKKKRKKKGEKRLNKKKREKFFVEANS